MDDAEFMQMLAEACNGEHCPEDLVKMAKTKWQKQVAVEFVLQDKRLNKTSHRVDVIYTVTWGIFALTAIACVVQCINTLFGPFL